jgi:hypothetical protein
MSTAIFCPPQADSAVLRFELFGNRILFFSRTSLSRIIPRHQFFLGRVVFFGKQTPSPQFMAKSATLFTLQHFFWY